MYLLHKHIANTRQIMKNGNQEEHIYRRFYCSLFTMSVRLHASLDDDDIPVIWLSSLEFVWNTFVV